MRPATTGQNNSPRRTQALGAVYLFNLYSSITGRQPVGSLFLFMQDHSPFGYTWVTPGRSSDRLEVSLALLFGADDLAVQHRAQEGSDLLARLKLGHQLGHSFHQFTDGHCLADRLEGFVDLFGFADCGKLLRSGLLGGGSLLVKLLDHGGQLGDYLCGRVGEGILACGQGEGFSGLGQDFDSGGQSNTISHLQHSIIPFWFVRFSFLFMYSLYHIPWGVSS